MTTYPYETIILPGFNPDPTICRVGGDYFISTSSFEYYPGCPIYHSRDLVNWKIIGHALTRPSQLTLRSCGPSGGIFAPTLRHWKGRFYLTVCAFHQSTNLGPTEGIIGPRGFYVWTDNIWDDSTWSDPVYYDAVGIDQDLFFDDDGSVYMSLASVGDPLPDDKGFVFRVVSKSCKIDLSTGRSLTPLTTLAINSTRGNPICEGPHIFKRNGWYYLSTAEGGTEAEHQQIIYRSRSARGPFEPGPEKTVNPMVYNGMDEHVRLTGHMDMVDDEAGRWWAVFLAVRQVKEEDGKIGESQLGRETFLCPVEWRDDWPIVNGGQKVSLTSQSPVRMPVRMTADGHLPFTPETDLHKQGWYLHRTPIKTEHSLSARPGYLTLFGGPYDIRTDEAITMIAQRQDAFSGTFEVTVEHDAGHGGVGSEAGVCVWTSKYAFASMGIRGDSEGKHLVFRHPVLEDDSFKEVTHPLSTNHPLTITIQATPLEYDFSVREQNTSAVIASGTFSSRLQVRRRKFDSFMTGSHFALYAQGSKGQAALEPAYFSGVSWSTIS